MEFMVLDKSDKNKKDTTLEWDYIQDELEKEVKALAAAIENKRCKDNNGMNTNDGSYISEETLNIVQTCIGIMDKLYSEQVNIEQSIHRHNKKLINNGCRPKAIIKLQVSKR